MNEWFVAARFTADGALSPRGARIVRAFDLLLVGAGLLSILARKRLARTGGKEAAAALLLGVVTALGLLACVEIPFYLLNRARDRAPELERTYSAGFIAFDPVLGHRPLPSGRYTESVSFQGKPIFSKNYAIDAYRCRVVPVQPKTAVPRALVFFGCSFTFGTGVDDEETLPSRVAERMPDARVYNLAGVGDGPQQMLAQLEDGGLNKRIAERDRLFVYVFIPQHLERSIHRMRHTVAWGRNDPAYARQADGRMAHLGTVAQAYPVTMCLYDLIAREQLLRYRNIDWPLGIGEAHIQYNADLVAAAADAAKSRHGARFAVVFYPLSKRVGASLGVDWDHVKAVFESRNLRVFDYRDETAAGDEGLFYPGDEHPTAAMHQRVAARLADDLRKFSGW